MRIAIIAALCSALAFAAPPAKKPAKAAAPTAPTKEAPADTEEDTGEEEDAEGGAPEGSVKVKSAGKEADGAGTQHTVQKGDTLWDLSQRYLGSPWYWPKVWSYNPEIANPHWIYPGNVVRFFSTGEEVPTQVELGTEPEAPDVSPGTLLEEDKVQVVGKIGYNAPAALMFRPTGFVTSKEIEEAGAISGAFEQSDFLTSNMQVYVTFKNKSQIKIGDRFVIFKPAKKIYHPKSDDFIGYLTQYTGAMKIVKTDGPMLTAMITDAFDVIQRGDMLAPFSEALARRVAARPNDKQLDGTVVAQIGIGTYITVIIDKGSDQGVQVGNTFTFLRQQDGLEHRTINYPPFRDEHYPIEKVGSCIAWEVKSTTTSCVIVAAMRDLVVGDWVQMQTGGTGAPRAAAR
jgi:hypothetical protein